MKTAAAVGGVFTAGILALLLLLVGIGGANTAIHTSQPQPAGSIDTGAGGALKTDGIPAADVAWVKKAASICPKITAPIVAGLIKVESSWQAHASSGVAFGIAQWTPASWLDWGVDGDGDGHKNLYDPADAIMATGHRLCHDSAQISAAAGLNGDPVDLALAAYHDGMGAVTAAGGMPASSLTRWYVATIKKNAATLYTAAASAITGTAGPLPAGVVGTVIAAARAQLGKPYVFGSTGPNSWDCSSLVRHAWRAAGVQLPRVTFQQVVSPLLVRVPLDQARAGDIVFFQIGGRTSSWNGQIGSAGPWDHVALVSDSNGNMIEAPHTGVDVRYESYRSSYYQARPTIIMRVKR